MKGVITPNRPHHKTKLKLRVKSCALFGLGVLSKSLYLTVTGRGIDLILIYIYIYICLSLSLYVLCQFTFNSLNSNPVGTVGALSSLVSSPDCLNRLGVLFVGVLVGITWVVVKILGSLGP